MEMIPLSRVYFELFFPRPFQLLVLHRVTKDSAERGLDSPRVEKRWRPTATAWEAWEKWAWEIPNRSTQYPNYTDPLPVTYCNQWFVCLFAIGVIQGTWWRWRPCFFRRVGLDRGGVVGIPMRWGEGLRSEFEMRFCPCFFFVCHSLGTFTEWWNVEGESPGKNPKRKRQEVYKYKWVVHAYQSIGSMYLYICLHLPYILKPNVGLYTYI